MQQVPDTNTIINVAIISQYLYDRALYDNRFYNKQQIDPNRPQLLYMVRKDVQYLFGLNPSDPGLTKISAYLFGLCAPFIPQALQIISRNTVLGPLVTGPTDQVVTAGNNATFSVTVSGVSPFTYQWYDYLGNIITGATGSSYTLPNAQVTDSGHTFFVKVTDANGKLTTSRVATLTVTAALTGYFSYGDVDPDAALQAHTDPFAYPQTFNITHNSPFSINVPLAASNNKFLIAKVPDTESIKTIWNNTALNNGTIPDFNWRPYVQFGGFTYYYTRQAVNMDISQPLILS